MNKRQQRKLDHVKLAIAHPEGVGSGSLPAPGWSDVHLLHRSLPEMALSEVDLSTAIGGVRLDKPVIINAMTGGTPAVEALNRDLAQVAGALGLAMAVGSQTAALREPELAQTYRVVRQMLPNGVVIANVSASATVEQAKQAVEMMEADLLQVHLNAPQELVMPEGDRDFRGQLDRIQRLVSDLPVPVVVKECGFGLSRETVQTLYEVGVRAVDVSGRGGTNFAWIEAERGGEELDPGILQWGIPTAVAVAEAAALGLPDLAIIASGGIRYGTDAGKALALGSHAVGVAGEVLRRYCSGGVSAAREYLERLLYDLTRTMLLCGAHSLEELRRHPVVITGETGQWLRLRGVDLEALARR